ncbi:MAG: hypothetical protein ABSG99_04825 [Sedimentisphaerales bacterium]
MQKDWDDYHARNKEISNQLDYKSIIANTVEYIMSDVTRKYEAAKLYQLYLAIEDLVGWIRAREGWLSNDEHGRAGIHEATEEVLKRLCDVVYSELETKSEAITLLRKARDDIQYRSSKAHERIFLILCSSVQEVQESLNRLRDYISSHCVLEDLL